MRSTLQPILHAPQHGKDRFLNAMGITVPMWECVIRFSFCPFNTIEEISTATETIKDQVAFLRRYKRR